MKAVIQPNGTIELDSLSDEMKAYDERKAYYESRYSATKYWAIYSKKTKQKVKETSRGWEVAEYDPDKVIVKHISYKQ